MIAAALAVEDGRISSMFVFFFIALLLVSPFGYRQIKASMAERRELLGQAGPGTAPAGDPPGAAATPSAGPDDLARVIGAITTAATELPHDPGGHRLVDVPPAPTVEGRPATAAVVEALLDDAVRRGGLIAVTTATPDGGRRLRLARA